MESVVAPVMGQLHGASAVARGGVHLEYFGCESDSPFEDPEDLMSFKRRRLTEDGFRVIDSQVHYDPSTTPRYWGWVVYTEGV